MRYLFLIIPIILLLTSCVAKQTKKLDFQDSIQNKYWKLISINGKTIIMKPDQEREIYFILKGNQTINGFAGCNKFQGKYQLADKDKINIYNVSITDMACKGIEEQTFLNIINNSKEYTLEKDRLKLYQSRTMSAIFEAVYF